VAQRATTNNNNQVFYSQASWGRLDMKSYEKKNKREKEGKNKDDKKRRKDNKTLSKKK
jgi:hypothetical protein